MENAVKNTISSVSASMIDSKHVSKKLTNSKLESGVSPELCRNGNREKRKSETA